MFGSGRGGDISCGAVERRWPTSVATRIRGARFETVVNTIGFYVIFQNVLREGIKMVHLIRKGAERANKRLPAATMEMVVMISRSQFPEHFDQAEVAKAVLRSSKTSGVTVEAYLQSMPDINSSFTGFFEGQFEDGDNTEGLV